MELNVELEKLKKCYLGLDVEKFKEQYVLVTNNFTSESDVKKIDKCIDSAIKQSRKESNRDIEEIRLRTHLIMNKEIIPFSYIAKNYFKKSKEWLYQRLNENLVNGKPAKFSENEVQTFTFALHDIGKKLGSIA